MFLLRVRLAKTAAILPIASVLLAACDRNAPGGHPDAAADSQAAGGCPATELAGALDQARATIGAAAATAVILRANCAWNGASGRADVPNDVAVRPGDRLRVGSVTKTFTAALVLQLVDEGRVRLDDVLESWVPGVANGAAITIEQLLRHTSGVADYLDQGFFPLASEQWTPEQIVAYANAKPPAFAPGTNWGYSNTNYILLGMVIERATGNSYHQQLHSRLLDPLQLADTFVEGDEDIPGGFIRGYVQQNGAYVDVRDAMNGSAAWAAGAIVSTASDIARFGRELLRGNLLSPGRVAEMTARTTLPDGSTVDFGMGLIMTDSPYGPLQGNNGRAIGFRSDLIYVPGRDMAVAVLVNDGDADPGTIRDALLQAALP
jgi:D-alanyl-D-alanine carboxypeptidase